MMMFRRSSALSDGFIEAMWETLIAVATAVAICVSLISLSAHLNEVKTVREAGIRPTQSTVEQRSPPAANVGAEAASQFD